MSKLSVLTNSTLYASLETYDRAWLIEQLYRMWFNNDRLQLVDMYAFHKELKKYNRQGAFNVDKKLIYNSAFSQLLAQNPVTETQFIRQLQGCMLKRPMAASVSPAAF